jgi:PIN domain nuclease of toxin-antitoxin system
VTQSDGVLAIKVFLVGAVTSMARIEIEEDLLLALAKEKIPRNRLGLEHIQINSRSIFELQAKAAKLKVNAEYVSAIQEISRSFTVEPYYSPDIVRRSFELEPVLPDYIDCIIVASAIELGTDLITEDTRIRKSRSKLEKKYGIGIFTFEDLLKESASGLNTRISGAAFSPPGNLLLKQGST